ncbi:pentatricopeptide repeat-containing protein [Carex littledalei]|uniref:Pentatricopeptide repeat-containing protein n=1 Tax=Carex littledalei TaxID=544730 RepID=A0A833V744_9POAL|nr:pentatricopeptide repeat-containing protein [Carex littledalei]
MALLSRNNLLNPHHHLSFPSNKLKLTTLPLIPSKPSIPSLHLTSTLASTQDQTISSNPDKTIRALCFFGQLDKAIHVFNSSQNHTFEEDTYISLIFLCRSKHAIPEGCRVYAHLNSSQTHINLRVGNCLLHMLTGFEKLLTASNVFAKMPRKDVFSWNVMVCGYGKTGFLDEAIDWYQGMLWACVKPDIYTFACVLRCCGGLSDLRKGKVVHAHVIRFGFGSEVDVSNALIIMYGKCSDLLRARKVFDEMPIRDCISWNAMIRGYFENYKNAVGIELFLTMLGRSLEPSLFALTSVISHCELDLGEALHGYTIKTGFALDDTICNSLIKMYSTSTRMDKAVKVFSRTKDRSLISWTAMISGYEQNGSPGKALDLFYQMEANNVAPDEATIASVLAACACLGRLDVGLRLHKLATRKGFETYAKVANSLIYLYSKLQCIDQAVEVFKRVPDKEVVPFSTLILGFNINRRYLDSLRFFCDMHRYVQPNDAAFMGALGACAELGAAMCGKEIHARALRVGFGFEGCLANSILAMYAKCGRMDNAWSQFRIMHGWNDVVSWNIMIMGHACLGEATRAINLFNRMIRHARIRPDEVTFLSLLCACSRSNMVIKGREYFSIMTQKYSIIPNIRHYGCMVHLLSRAGLLDEARKFIEEMPIKPDPSVWAALLDGCRIHGRFELGEFAAKFLFELAPENVGYLLLYCKFYADLGRWDGVDRVRKLMRQKGLETNPGCSWIEVKGSIHAFLTQDNSHPQIKEIQTVLNGLYKRITDNGFDPVENGSEKDDVLCGHSERSALAFGLINSVPGTPVKLLLLLAITELSSGDTSASGTRQADAEMRALLGIYILAF